MAENISERRPVFIICSSPILPPPMFVWKWIQPKSKIWQTNSILADHNGQSYFDNRSSSATATAIINARTTISRVNESKRKSLNSLKTNIGISISIRKSIHPKKRNDFYVLLTSKKKIYEKQIHFLELLSIVFAVVWRLGGSVTYLVKKATFEIFCNRRFKCVYNPKKRIRVLTNLEKYVVFFLNTSTY